MVSTPPTVLAIGSCRIFRPLRPVHEQGGINLINYIDHQWFTHTAAAARQYVEVMQGDAHIPAELRGVALETDIVFPEDMSSPAIHDVDVVVVEVSTLKQARIGAVELNSHKLYQAAYKIGPEHRDIVQGRTGALPEGHLLKDLRVNYTTSDEMDADLLAIRDKVGAPVMTVNHLPSFLPDGSPAPERVKLTNELRRVEATYGMPMYDTTQLVMEHGIDIALTDPTHYRLKFEPVVAERMLAMIREVAGARV